MVWDRWNGAWFPENVLVDTVARLQQDLAGGSTCGAYTSAGGFYDDQSASVWRVFDAIVLSNGGDDATAAVKAFGDMGHTARLRLIHDHFIAGHSSCELRRYLDSVPPETPIRYVVDRCRVWESHADPEIRRVSKPDPEPIYPTYVVGDSDNVVEEIRVAAVTKPKSTPDQVEDLLRRLLAGMASPAPVPAPVPEVPMVEKLLQHLLADTQICQPAPVIPSEPRSVVRFDPRIPGEGQRG